jgi:chitin disaccharide deacetylase
MSAGSTLPPGLIVNADDLGIHPSINDGILSAHRHGIVSSATMLMTTPYLVETIREIRNSSLPVGIHLSLTLGKTIAGHSNVPDLVDDNSDFNLTARRILLCSFSRDKERRTLPQIRREFEAQLSLARDHGIRATHADSHQHIHMNPAIFFVLEELLPRYGIKRLRYSRETFAVRGLGELVRQGKITNLAKIALLRKLSRRIRPQLTTTDGFFGVLHSGAVSRQALRAAILRHSRTHSLEVCIHPGFSAARDETTYPQSYVNEFISSSLRRTEHDLLIDREFLELVQQRGLVLRDFDGRQKRSD